MHYLILGGGIAGTTAAEALRKADARADITIIEQETHPCYSRVLLPHYVKGVVPREKVFLRQPQWYHEQRIDWQTGVRVTAIDTRNMFVRTSEEREIPYDKLLLATGGEVRLAPSDTRGMSYLHTLDDAEHLRALLREAQTLPKERRRAVVFGGGFIAMEYINIFAHYGMPTTVILRGNGFWSRTLSVEAQDYLLHHAHAMGVTVVANEDGLVTLGDKEVLGVRLNDGSELSASIVGIGIGIATDVSVVRAAGIATGQGILANAMLETNVPHVYTAGDAAELLHPLFGRHLTIGTWLNAQMQGRAVANAMCGRGEPFTLLTSYATHLLGAHIVFIGDTSRQHADVVNRRQGTDGVIDLYMRDGRAVGAVLVGDVRERAVLTKAIQEKLIISSSRP